MDELEVDAGDAIRLILQFLRENRLFGAMRALQEETQIALPAVDSRDALLGDIAHGRWDSVLAQTRGLGGTSGAMMALYEQIVREMLEAQEAGVARELLHHAEPLAHMRTAEPERYARLEALARGATAEALAGGASKHEARRALAEQFEHEITEVPPLRLLTLLGQALKWQALQGHVAPGADIDLFRGAPRLRAVDHADRVARKAAGKIKFSKSSAPRCLGFSRDGRMLTSGSNDGFIEVWDHDSGKLRRDLEYQAKEEFMMHDKAVTAQCFSVDGEILATGSEDGKIKVWNVTTGVCLRRFENAHAHGIHSLCFSRDGTQLLSASFDRAIRVHGLKSGQLLKEFHGHESYVNDVQYDHDGATIVSASSDGTVRIWDPRSTDCIRTIRLPTRTLGEEVDAVRICLTSGDDGHKSSRRSIVVCTRTPVMYLVSMDGEIVRSFKTDANNEEELGHFVDCVLSPHGKYLYGATDKGFLLAFVLASGDLEATTRISNGAPAVGVVHHPHRNLVATFGTDAYVRLWKA